jgi:hypothetical protein
MSPDQETTDRNIRRRIRTQPNTNTGRPDRGNTATVTPTVQVHTAADKRGRDRFEGATDQQRRPRSRDRADTAPRPARTGTLERIPNPQVQLSNQFALQAVGEYMRSQNLTNTTIDLSTDEGRKDIVHFLAGVSSMVALRAREHGGVQELGDLGLDLGNIVSVFLPELRDSVMIVFSPRANWIPKKIDTRLDAIFEFGTLFWCHTVEYAHDRSHVYGSKVAPSVHGPVTPGWRLQMTMSANRNVVHSTW